MFGSSSFPLHGLCMLLAALPFGADAGAAANAGRGDPVELWANAAGGRERIAAVRSVYREATVQIAGLEGSIKAWHTADGKYRKEEHVASFSAIETFDGANGTVQTGSAPARKMTALEIPLAISRAYANWNAVFFAFFPERRNGRGSLSVPGEGDERRSIVLRPAGGIDWRITLDPETSLPKVMEHEEGGRTVTVTFVAWETVDGIRFEKEVLRSNGDPRFDAVVRFTKTVLNPPLEAAFFSAEPETATAAR